MTTMRCEKCGVDANVIAHIKQLETEKAGLSLGEARMIAHLATGKTVHSMRRIAEVTHWVVDPAHGNQLCGQELVIKAGKTLNRDLFAERTRLLLC